MKNTAIGLVCLALLASCGAIQGGGDDSSAPDILADTDDFNRTSREGRTTLSALFNRGSPENKVEVNRYIWRAALDVLNFLPIQTVDPFTGLIVTGYGTPPGGGRAYRATVYVSDPALEARSLKVALQTRRGPVSTSTQRAVEDAILARARQLRGEDSRF